MRKSLFWALVFTLSAFLVSVLGCSSSASYPRPEAYYEASPPADESDLFASVELLSDAEIEKILSYRLKLAKLNRIAILRLSRESSWNRYSNEFNQLNSAVSSKFINALMQSDKVYDASFLPSMLIPDKRTVPYLREASARYQADLLLVYRPTCNSYQKYRFMSSDQTKAYCSVEAALLDIRKGIVPFTAIASNDFVAYKNSDDVNFRETMKKAEIEAVSQCLQELAFNLAAFLDQQAQSD